jgi:hypothetical protein
MDALLELASGEDLLELHGNELYWLPRAGTLDSPLDMMALNKTIGPLTVRTMGTVELIVEKWFRD